MILLGPGSAIERLPGKLEARSHRWDVIDFAFSADGRSLVSGSSEGTALVWDTEGVITTPVELRGHTGGIASVANCSAVTRACTKSQDECRRLLTKRYGRSDDQDSKMVGDLAAGSPGNQQGK